MPDAMILGVESMIIVKVPVAAFAIVHVDVAIMLSVPCH